MIEIKNSVCGFYKIEAVAPDGSRRLLADWFPNLITDIGLDRLGSLLDCGSFCRVGTSNTAPAFTDTQLGAQVASTNTEQTATAGASGSAPYYAFRTITYRFAAFGSSQNLNEVGVGWASSGATLFSRALTTDGAGTPTTITVLAGEILDVTYQIRVYAPTADVISSLTIEGTSRTITLRASAVTAGAIDNQGSGSGFKGPYYFGTASVNSVNYYSGDAVLGAVTGAPTATQSDSQSGTITTGSYTNGTYYLDCTYFINLSESNFTGGIGAMRFRNNFGYFQFSIATPALKTASKTMTTVVRVSWVRH